MNKMYKKEKKKKYFLFLKNLNISIDFKKIKNYYDSMEYI